MVSPIFAVYFLILLVIGVPVLFALGLSPAIALLQADKALFMNLLYQRLYAGLDNFSAARAAFLHAGRRIHGQRRYHHTHHQFLAENGAAYARWAWSTW